MKPFTVTITPEMYQTLDALTVMAGKNPHVSAEHMEVAVDVRRWLRQQMMAGQVALPPSEVAAK